MTERKTFAFNWELILPGAPKAKGACHFTIKDIFSKGIKRYFSMMVPQCWQQRIFKVVRLFWGTYNWTSVTDNFNIRYWFFFLSFLWRSEQRGQGRTSKCHQDHPPTWRSHKPSKWVEVSIVLSFTCSVLLFVCGFVDFVYHTATSWKLTFHSHDAEPKMCWIKSGSFLQVEEGSNAVDCIH